MCLLQARFKGTKFELRPDEVAALEGELGPLAAPGLRSNLFSKEFKRHVLAADALRGWVSSDGDEVCGLCL
jgi:hypothetical protein